VWCPVRTGRAGGEHRERHVRRDTGVSEAATSAVSDAQLRHNLRKATHTIRAKRAAVVGEQPDWVALREAGAAIKDRTLRHLDVYLERLEAAVVAAGGQVHWAEDASEANRIVVDLVKATGESEVVKVKSMATQEIDLNAALDSAGIRAYETDLAELIVQLGPCASCDGTRSSARCPRHWNAWTRPARLPGSAAPRKEEMVRKRLHERHIAISRLGKE